MPSKLVLLAEPDEDHREIFRTILEHHGYEVLDSTTADDAVRFARERRPDLVLVAFPLVTADRRTLIEALRDDPTTERIPVLAVVAEDQPWEVRRAYDLGASDHCTKPVDPRLIAVQVRNMIGASVERAQD